MAHGEPKSIGMMPCGLFWHANAQRTVVQNPASIAMTAVWIIPMPVAPPMSMVEQKVRRDAEECRHTRRPAVLLAHDRRHEREDAVDRVARHAAVVDRRASRPRA
jgi:hypothetical protein